MKRIFRYMKLLTLCLLLVFTVVPHKAQAAEDYCNRCNRKVTITQKATCTSPAKAKCSKCGSVTTVGKKKGHSYGSYVTVKKATCKETGLKKQVCLVCGKSITKTVSKTNSHSFSLYKRATCVSKAVRKCRVCGKMESYGNNDTSNHSWGKMKNCFKTCKLCGKTVHI